MYQLKKNVSLTKLAQVAKIIGYRKEGYEQLGWGEYQKLPEELKALYDKVS